MLYVRFMLAYRIAISNNKHRTSNMTYDSNEEHAYFGRLDESNKDDERLSDWYGDEWKSAAKGNGMESIFEASEDCKDGMLTYIVNLVANHLNAPKDDLLYLRDQLAAIFNERIEGYFHDRIK